MKWNSLDAAAECTLQFPKLTEDELRNLTIGVYQLKTAKSYSSEHFTTDGFLGSSLVMKFQILFVLKFKVGILVRKNTCFG